MEEDDEDVPSPSDLSDSCDEFTGESEEEEEDEDEDEEDKGDDEERPAVKLRTSDEDRKSHNVDALLRSAKLYASQLGLDAVFIVFFSSFR